MPFLQELRRGHSLNIFGELDAASNNSVDDILQPDPTGCRLAPQVGTKKVCTIIDEVHMLSSAAFNAFLKTLEEPPSTPSSSWPPRRKHLVLPTIPLPLPMFDFGGS
ncbi:MAG: hypothetical protein IPH00_07445 [Flavobacteriales bacterium]|nr:hypothetical protein [Flavobacteriales bacterium]